MDSKENEETKQKPAASGMLTIDQLDSHGDSDYDDQNFQCSTYTYIYPTHGCRRNGSIHGYTIHPTRFDWKITMIYSDYNFAATQAARFIIKGNMRNDEAIELACSQGDLYLDDDTFAIMESLVAESLYELEGQYVQC